MASDSKYGEITASNKEFHPTEPLFVLRGIDAETVKTIWFYAQQCQLVGRPADHVESCVRRAAEILKWQDDNAKLVKKPD